jgi:hypothetical protein
MALAAGAALTLAALALPAPEFGNMRNGNTFGDDAQYGAVGPRTLGAFASAVQPNREC